MEMAKEHIGDGVYAEYDGFVIWLSTETGEGRIALEDGTLENLKAYALDAYASEEP
jgi:hypothetical protein